MVAPYEFLKVELRFAPSLIQSLTLTNRVCKTTFYPVATWTGLFPSSVLPPGMFLKTWGNPFFTVSIDGFFFLERDNFILIGLCPISFHKSI